MHPLGKDKTRERILQSAEELFSNQGFANTSLRAITTHAKVNLAAVNYHFGSKDALIQHIFKSRLGALNDERLQRLTALQREHVTPGVDAILHAYLAPTLNPDADPGEKRFLRLLGRTHLGASAPLRAFVHSLYAEVLDRFAGALARAIPHLGEQELYWRLHFLTGAVSYTLSAAITPRLDKVPPRAENGGDGDPGYDSAALLRRLLTFLAAGLQAPASDAVPAAADLTLVASAPARSDFR